MSKDIRRHRSELTSLAPQDASIPRVLTLWLGIAILLSLACISRSAPLNHVDGQLALAEQRTYEATNQQRLQRDLPPLLRSSELDHEARLHSQRMANGRVGFSHHGSSDRAQRLYAALSLDVVAENVAKNRGFEDPVQAAVDGWMSSKPHRRNVVGDYHLTGVGIAKGKDGTVYFTQIFGKKVDR